MYGVRLLKNTIPLAAMQEGFLRKSFFSKHKNEEGL